MDIYLTTSEAIRAALGVSNDSQELPDSVFVDADLELEIESDMAAWLLAEVGADIDVVLSLATDTLRTSFSLCAKYFGALLLLPSLTTATASKLSDGQDEFQRQDRDIAELRADLQAQLYKHQRRILDALSVTPPSQTFGIMGVSSPASDPITGA